MNARFYVSGIGRFASADTLVPDPTNPQSYNRYTYVLNNALRHTDPTGHCIFGWPCPKPIQNIIDYFSPNSEPTTVAHTEVSEYSDWYGGAYSGCQMCHAAKETPYTALNNGQMVAVRDQMDEAAFTGAVAMGTGVFAGLVGGHFATAAACGDGDCTNEVSIMGERLYRFSGKNGDINPYLQKGEDAMSFARVADFSSPAEAFQSIMNSPARPTDTYQITTVGNLVVNRFWPVYDSLQQGMPMGHVSVYGINWGPTLQQILDFFGKAQPVLPQ